MSAGHSVGFTVPAVINGTDTATSIIYDVVSPTTGQVIHRACGVSVDEAIQVVDAAQDAFRSWKNTPAHVRRDIFLKAADILVRRSDELASYMEDETGSAEFWSRTINLPESVSMLRDVAGRTIELEGRIANTAQPGVGGLIVKEPYGVVLGIAPWNAPYILGFRAVAYAIAAGNTTILKASERSPRCMWAIGSVFREAGLPDGVLNVISHRTEDAAAVTRALIEHPLVRKINFTGSTAVGRIVGEMAGRALKPLVLELGGKAPAIVLEDADLGDAAKWCSMGAFLHAGQICMSTERIIVVRSVADEFAAQMRLALATAHSDAVVLINSAAAARNKQLVADAVSKGATMLHGTIDLAETSTRMQPVVVRGVTPAMELYHAESFGPTVSVIEVEDETEAIRVANDTEHGLSSAVFSRDLRRALRVARQLESGAVHINRMTVHDEAGLPHGGRKASGFGRFGATAMSEWVQTKSITFDG